MCDLTVFVCIFVPAGFGDDNRMVAAASRAICPLLTKLQIHLIVVLSPVAL